MSIPANKNLEINRGNIIIAIIVTENLLYIFFLKQLLCITLLILFFCELIGANNVSTHTQIKNKKKLLKSLKKLSRRILPNYEQFEFGVE